MKSLYHQLKTEIRYLKKVMPMIHVSDDHLSRPEMRSAYDEIDTSFKTGTSLFYTKLAGNQQEIFEIMQEYDKTIAKSLVLLKSSKSLSASGTREDSLYMLIAEKYHLEYERFNAQAESYEFDLKAYNKLLTREIKPLGRAAALFAADRWLENIRHRSYLSFRRYMRNSENNRAKFFQKQLRSFKTVSLRSLRFERKKSFH